MIFHRTEIIADLKRVVKDNENKTILPNSQKVGKFFLPETIEKINQTIALLQLNDMVLNRIDLLLNYDLSEDLFIRQCDEDSKLLSEEARKFLRGI